MLCPFCGGKAEMEWHAGTFGDRRTSPCCGVPFEFVELYDLLKALPQDLQDVAITTRKAEYAVIEEKEREQERQCVETDKWIRERYPDWEGRKAQLMKGNRKPSYV